MEQFEDFFEKNIDSFNDQKLALGHEQRFLKKLEKNKSSVSFKWWYGVAAGFILLAMLSFFARGFIFRSSFVAHNSQIVCLSDISSNYQEVEKYYLAGVNKKIDEFKQLQCNIDKDQQLQINKELAQFDLNYLNLQAELKKNMNDERIIDAMIVNYETKMRFLELVIDQIKQNC
jgi:hypothetical protein